MSFCSAVTYSKTSIDLKYSPVIKYNIPGLNLISYAPINF